MADRRINTVDVVLFDLDDTLFAHSRAVSHGVLAHRRAHGGAMAAADDVAEGARWTALEEHHYHRYLSGELDVFEQRRARARGFVEPYGLDLTDDSVADEWWARYFVEYQNAWELYDDTRSMLDALADFRLGIITNGTVDFQTAKLEAMGIAGRFEKLIASGSFGVAKPDVAIFEHAVEQFGVTPSRAVYIGDRLDTDAVGAANAGLHGVWLVRDRDATTEEAERAAASGVAIIHSLAEVPSLCERFEDAKRFGDAE